MKTITTNLTTSPLRTFAVILLATVFLSACQKPGVDEQSASNAKTKKGIADVEWRTHGNDFGEQRFSSLDQINKASVEQLGLAWSFDITTKRGVEATPLMIDGVLYVTGSWSVVYALDAVNGKPLWIYDPKVDRSFLSKGCCDAVNRGVAYADGKIFVGAYDGRLIALDAKKGDVLWDVQTTDRNKSYTITGAPRIAGDKVVIGNGGAELGVRGYVSAYDLDSGEQAWRFYTVPGNPADGFESEAMKMASATWNGEWWKWGGGGTVWDSMVYDQELDLLYIGVGNGSPWNQNLRSPGGGDNLFLSSIVALRPDTGEYVWHYQTTPGETWDFTSTQHMMLADLEIKGEIRKVLMQAPKNGFFYILDRVNGELLSAEKFTTVTWASHIDMETGRPVEMPKARLFDGSQVIIPSMGGGHNWPPMSYNPNTGLVYIPTMVFPGTYVESLDPSHNKPDQGLWNLGLDTMATAPPKVSDADIAQLMEQSYTGQLLAWDPIKQEARWAQEVQRPNIGGTLATAGDLIFQGAENGSFVAYDAHNGERLWSQKIQTMAMAAPISYAIDGTQYVAIAVGFGGGFSSQGGIVAHSWDKRGFNPRVLVYKLGGEHQLPELQQEAVAELVKPAPATADAATIDLGQKVYQRHCAYCHGDGLLTGGINPDLRKSSAAIHSIWNEIVLDGIFKANGMIGFKDYINADEAEAIRQYVLSEANREYDIEHSKN